MKEYDYSARGDGPDNRAEELKQFKMTPEKKEASAVIKEIIELYEELSQVNEVIEMLEPFGRVERQFNELKRRRDAIIARLIELEEITKKEAERTFRMGGAALLGVRTGARGYAATLAVDDMFSGGRFNRSTRYNETTGYIGAIKREFGRRLSLGDEESSE